MVLKTEEDMNAKAQLCYVDLPFVWFTTDFVGQWGDDWDDIPYECNAGQPYPPKFIGRDYELFRVAVFPNPYKHQLRVPADAHYSSPWSVMDINNKLVPWLRLMNLDWDSPTIEAIMAGTTYAAFKDFAYHYGLLLWSPGLISLPNLLVSKHQ